MLTPKDWAAIRASTLAQGFSAEELSGLIDPKSEIVLRRGDELFVRGDPAHFFFLLLEGQIKLVRMESSGEEAVIDICRAGDTIAGPALFLEGYYPVTAVAVTQARLVPIASAAARALILAKPAAALAFLTDISRQYARLVDDIESMKLRSGEERVVRFLLNLCPDDKGPAQVTLPHEKILIARRLGLQPETFSRALARLAAFVVDVQGKIVKIDEVERLAKKVSLDAH